MWFGVLFFVYFGFGWVLVGCESVFGLWGLGDVFFFEKGFWLYSFLGRVGTIWFEFYVKIWVIVREKEG